FSNDIVGGKSWHLAQLRAYLPDGIALPSSVAIPFGVFEKVLSLPANKSIATRYAELARKSQKEDPELLLALRKTVLELNHPPDLEGALKKAFDQAGLKWPKDWEKAWRCIKQVWASKWNERAFLSRKRMGIAHESLFMAGPIQQSVPTAYPFVVHKVNPSNAKVNELFAEIVLGLGEALVGNYPGRALSFVWDKTTSQPTILSYSSKSTGLYGGNLIFRSDSNGEDLENYAGAGLYDSVLLEEPRRAILDYTQEPLLWDESFRLNLLSTIARIGVELERACGSAQDIE